MSEKRQLSHEEIDALLAEGGEVHVVEMHPAQDSREYYVARSLALSHAAEKGAYLAGENARQANHGLCSPSQQGGWYFWESKHG